MPSREEAKAAAERLQLEAFAAAAKADADRARELIEQAELAERLLDGQHEKS